MSSNIAPSPTSSPAPVYSAEQTDLIARLLEREIPAKGQSGLLTVDISKLEDLDTLGVMGLLPQLLTQPAVTKLLASKVNQPLVSAHVQAVGDRLVLIGQAPNGLIGSQYLEVAHGLKTAPVHERDAVEDKAIRKVLLTLAGSGILTAATSLREGGLMVALTSLVLGPGPQLGVKIDLNSFGAVRSDMLLFGEDPGRLVFAVRADRIGSVISESHMGGVAATVIGEIIESPELSLVTRRVASQWQIATLRAALNLARR